MTGADILGAIAREDMLLLAVVPAERLKGGRLPDGIPLPAVVFRTVSSIDRQPLKRGHVVRVTDRVSATVRAKSLREQRVVIDLLRRACAGKTGDIGGGRSVSILTAGTGPDLDGPGNSYEQAQDFRVSFDDAA